MSSEQPGSQEKILSLLSRIGWDHNLTPRECYQLLIGENKEIRGMDINHIYYRILTSFDWYAILEMIPAHKLHQAVSPSVVNKIKSETLREKFIHARHILSGQTVPISG